MSMDIQLADKKHEQAIFECVSMAYSMYIERMGKNTFNAGNNDFPRSVKEYSTFGGIVSYCTLLTS